MIKRRSKKKNYRVRGLIVNLSGTREDKDFVRHLILASNSMTRIGCSTKHSLLILLSGYLAEEANRIEREN